jgi:hypothetical protein
MISVEPVSFSFLLFLRILFGFSLADPRGYPRAFMIIMVVHLLRGAGV